MKTNTLLLCLAIIGCGQLSSQTLDKKFASTDGKVYASVQNGDTVYIGGDFTQVGIGKKGLAKFNAGSDKPDINFPELGGADKVNAMEPDGSGGFYLGGYFDSYDGLRFDTATAIIHVLSNGKIDPSFKTVGADGEVSALKKVKNRLYIGGYFQNIQGVNEPYFAALNAASGTFLQGWIPDNPGSPVLQIDANDSLVFINVSNC
jgi:hypothetical protein